MEIFDTQSFLQKSGLFWQYPVITEKEFYKQNNKDPFYCGIPWATIIDKRINTNELLRFTLQFTKQKEYYTCCQHISFRKLIPFFKIIGVKILYTPHKVIGEDEINGIRIMPCPLYAVNFEDTTRNKEFLNKDFVNLERNILYSFMGGFQIQYLTDIRKKIFNLERNKNNKIINTGDWHFNKTVYSSKQNKNNEIVKDKEHINKTQNYNKLLLKSRYSLCPSGSGPNSIRFWESLACGSIPVLLADTLELPYNIEWDEAIIRVNEKDIFNIDSILNNISIEEEKERRKKCIEIYNVLKNDFKFDNFNDNKEDKITIFTSYLCDINDHILQHILRKWRVINKNVNILYFSDKDVHEHFKTHTKYFELYSKMKNGVAIADFFRMSYINNFGGFWFDLDLEAFEVNIDNSHNVNLFDCGFKNISYMFIGGKPNQYLFNKILDTVTKNINKNISNKTQHVMDITGPRIIQNIICEQLGVTNKDGCLPGYEKPKIYLKDTKYEFNYSKINIGKHKIDYYVLLQQKYKKSHYQAYNYI